MSQNTIIKERRIQLGMSQEELAKATGYTDRSSIAKIETGANGIPQSKIQLFADVLGVQVSDLFGLDPLLELPEELQGINYLMYSLGYHFIRTDKGYFIADIGTMSEDDIQLLVSQTKMAIKNCFNYLRNKKMQESILELSEAMKNGKA